MPTSRGGSLDLQEREQALRTDEDDSLELRWAATLPVSPSVSPLQAGPSVGKVDLDDLRTQLEQIRDALTPVIEDATPQRRIRLETIEIDLTVGLEGQIWFIAKGKGEASIKLQFSRNASD